MSDLNYTPAEQLSNIDESEFYYSFDIASSKVIKVLRVLDAADVSKSNDAPARAPLSTVHKRPFAEIYVGSSLLKISRGIESDAPHGGKKGKISGFSYASRRAMLRMISTIKIDSEMPCFGTITYPENFPPALESKRQLRIFIKRLLRAFPDIGLIWKLEPQERGAPHYHFLIWGPSENDLFNFFVEHWHNIAGQRDPNHKLFLMGALKDSKPCVEAVQSRRGVLRYASKYLAKAFDVSGWNFQNHGRYWAVVNRENIPFATKYVYEISSERAEHIMRYMRRFANLKGRSYKSLNAFVTVDYWMKKLAEEVTG